MSEALRAAGGEGRRGWLCVVSGKGGVGKSNVVANLAVAAAGLGASPLVVDGDLGLANLDVLLGIAPRRSAADALAGRCTMSEALVEGPRGIRILPAASARADLAAPDRAVLERFLALLAPVAARFDLVLVDSGAGIGPAVLGLAAACERVLVVTTPEPTSLADAYATVKALSRTAGAPTPDVIVNGAADELSARRAFARLELLARRFLATPLRLRGWLPTDPRLPAAVSRQRSVVEAFPGAPWSRRLVALAESILADTAPRRDCGGTAS